ncbi:MAG: hypothetical protein HPY45_04655 [Anaerolineae bacterium]|nr:hypothetical protein [Anaerolineae bacterium]
MESRSSVFKRGLFTLAGGLVLGTVVAWLSPGEWLRGWLAASFICWISLFCLASAWKWGGGGKTLAWMMTLAFVLRLGAGIYLTLALPTHGYDDPQQNAGYVFTDAYRRDTEAWGFTLSATPLWDIFKAELDTDQYGGLLILSGILYRYLSPDAHRPLLIILLAASFAALGVPFLHRAVCQRWEQTLADLTCWILVLYPDSILFGSSQMREPFLIGLLCIAFWGIVNWRQNRYTAAAAFLIGWSGMMVFSTRMGIAALAFLIVWLWLEDLLPKSSAWQWLGWVSLCLAGAGVVVLGWQWLHTTAAWDILLTERNSGRVQTAISELAGGRFGPQFIVIYGLAQPVLPAAIAEPALALWKTIAIMRSLGWYALAPFLLYGIFSVWKAQPGAEKRILIWVAIFTFAWLLISSMRAGGDQWDNPRYRMVFLPFLALLAAWAALRALHLRDLWLVRWFVVEAVFLGFFTAWYFSRYFQVGKRLPFWHMVAWIAALSALVLLSGVVWDLGRNFLKRRQNRIHRL